MGGADDDAIAFLEAAAAAENDQRAGAPIAVARAAHGALGAVGLEILAFAADDALGLDLVGAGILLRLPGEPLALVVGESLARQHQGQLRRLVEGGQLPPHPVFLGHVGGGLHHDLRDLDGQHITGVLGRIGIGLDPLDDEGEVAARKAEELANQPEALDAGLASLLQVQREAHGRVLEVDVPITFGGFREQADDRLLSQVGEEGLGLALRRGANLEPNGRHVRGPMGKRGPRGNRR